MRFLSFLKHIFSLNADTTEVVEQDIGELIHITMDNLPQTLKHMGLGMLSIFIVIGVIILLIFLLNKVMNRSPKKKEQ